MEENIVAPVEKGMQVGEIVYSVNGNELGRSKIVTLNSVDKMTFSKAFVTILKSMKKY